MFIYPPQNTFQFYNRICFVQMLSIWSGLQSCCFIMFTLEVPFTKVVAFVASINQDQAAQNMQPDLRSTLSAICKDTSYKR